MKNIKGKTLLRYEKNISINLNIPKSNQLCIINNNNKLTSNNDNNKILNNNNNKEKNNNIKISKSNYNNSTQKIKILQKFYYLAII